MKARSGPVGFSLRINDPAFAAYQKKSTAWSFIFAGILALAAAVGFPVYGKVSRDIEWPGSLFYGLGIGGMFLIIALIQTLRRNRDQTWEGTVAYKDSYRERSGRNRRTYRTVYVLKIDKDGGGTKQHKWRDFPGPSIIIRLETGSGITRVLNTMKNMINPGIQPSCASPACPSMIYKKKSVPGATAPCLNKATPLPSRMSRLCGHGNPNPGYQPA